MDAQEKASSKKSVQNFFALVIAVFVGHFLFMNAWPVGIAVLVIALVIAVLFMLPIVH